MPRFPRTFLAASVSAALFVPVTQAETQQSNSVQEMPSPDQCLIPDSSANNGNDAPIHVEANTLEGVNGDKATYKGDVVITQGNKRIEADTITLHQQDDIVVAEGNVLFSDGQVKTTSDKATTNLKTDQATLESAKYQFLCEAGRGEAEVIYRAGKKFYELEDGTLTSCPEGDNSWRLRASSIDIDQEAEEATFYNPRVEIGPVPVFYLPYLTVPIGDTRKTGFLYPGFSLDTRDGTSVQIPIYWNLAPEYDLRTTINYMAKRGTQLNSKFRYLTGIGSGDLNLEYLPDDKANEEKGKRWGFNWGHSGIYQEAWKFNIDYSKVSDISYFSDLSSSIGKREDGQLLQSGEVSYRSANWDSTLRVRDFQILSPNTYAYRLMPQLDFNYYAPRFYSKFDFKMKNSVSRFDTDDPNSPSATRVHMEPALTLPLATTWGSFTTEAKLYQTYYQQDLQGVTLTGNNANLKEKVHRTIPQFKVNSDIVLERNNSLINGYTQTLEPQVQYLYIQDVDQADIFAGYDTTKMQLDYHGLFRSQRYSGVDRIAPANQISYGASTRFYDKDYRERLNLSFGQILYLDSSYNDAVSGSNRSSYSAWAMEAEFNYDDTFFYRGGFQYDTDSSDVQQADSTLEYKYTNGFSQLNYRYVSLDYITNNVDFINNSNLDTFTKKGINQLGFITGYTYDRKIRFNGQYFYDLTEDINLEWLAGMTYTSDCWYIGFSYSNQLYRWPTSTVGVGTPEYDQKYSINFGIIGFGTSVGAGSGLAGLSGAGSSLGYGRPFSLNK